MDSSERESLYIKRYRFLITRGRKMQIFIKSHIGQVIAMEVETSDRLIDVAKRLLKRIAKICETAQETPEKYARAIIFHYRGRRLSLDRTFQEENIERDSVLRECVAPEIAEAIGTIDAITMEPIEIPLRLNPGCQHFFETSSLLRWMQTQHQQGLSPTCPTCRADISDSFSPYYQ